MRREMKSASFRLWRHARVSGRKTKHHALHDPVASRGLSYSIQTALIIAEALYYRHSYHSLFC